MHPDDAERAREANVDPRASDEAWLRGVELDAQLVAERSDIVGERACRGLVTPRVASVGKRAWLDRARARRAGRRRGRAAARRERGERHEQRPASGKGAEGTRCLEGRATHGDPGSTCHRAQEACASRRFVRKPPLVRTPQTDLVRPASPASRSFGRTLVVTLATVVASLGLAAAAARAQPRASYGQYLVVVDDSGSMDQSDPRRLVVMASLALAGALDDSDQVMLVGLNEIAGGGALVPSFVSPRELLQGRDGPDGARPVTGPRPAQLAQHRGQTPCRQALTIARDLLNGVSRAGAPQTLLLLTDGACNGQPVERAEAFLGGVSARTTDRFRFVVLTRAGRERVDPELARYAALTGWQGDPRIAFDARSLLRAFAEVLSFSRGLRFDDGGRVGLERTFAGARGVRVLAMSERGRERIGLVRVGEGADTTIAGGPTWRDAEHTWSLRVAREQARSEPYAVRAADEGVDVLVVPTYGQLRVEAVITSCGQPPPLPWDHEIPARAGQPVCAWARLVGDTRETIVRGRSFDFDVDLCEDAACASATAMQPAEDGTWNAQLGADVATGRHERFFRARGGALAVPVVQRAGFVAMSYGVRFIARAQAPTVPVTELDLGVLPRPTADTLSLVVSGAFPAGARARVHCEPEGDIAAAACVRCASVADELALQDGAELQVRVSAEPFCQPVSDDRGRDIPVRVRLVIEPRGTGATDVSRHELPMRAVLHYGALATTTVRVAGGDSTISRLPVPAAVPNIPLRVTIERASAPDDLVVAREGVGPMAVGEDGAGALGLRLTAEECCTEGHYPMTLVLAPASGGASLRVPVDVEVVDPGFLVCPGRKILRWGAVILALLFLAWLVHGITSPARFRDGALLLHAESHEALSALREGDDGWREVRRFAGTERGFRRHAAIHLGGARAPLPSLRSQPDDARIEARDGGGAVLIVRTPGVERFDESNGWTEVPVGESSIHNQIVLRRPGVVYVQFRR